MIIKRLSIRNYRRIKELDLELNRSPVVLPEQFSETIVKAIGVLTKNEVLSGGKTAWRLGKKAFLSLTLLLRDGLWTVTCHRSPETGKTEWKVYDSGGNHADPVRFLSGIHESPEESRAGCFDPEQSYEEVLKGYLEPERYFTPQQFFKMTEGIGTTRLFRMKLREVRNRGPSEKKGTERNHEFFRGIRSMWDEIEEVRNMYHERWPLFIWTESPDKAQGTGEYCPDDPGRQIFLIRRRE